jgi:hypothetical protein
VRSIAPFTPLAESLPIPLATILEWSHLYIRAQHKGISSSDAMCSGLQPSRASSGTAAIGTGERQPDATAPEAMTASVVPACATHAGKSQFISASTLDQCTYQDDLTASNSAELVGCVARALVLAIETPRLRSREQSSQISAPPTQVVPCNVFDSSQVPNISVERYLTRLKAVFQCSDAAFVLALIIVDRLLTKSDQEPHRLTMVNVHRLFLAGLIVSVKFNEDLVYGNSHYAKAGGIRLREVNRLERHLLWVLDYQIHVQPEEYMLYQRTLLVTFRSQHSSPTNNQIPNATVQPPISPTPVHHDTGAALGQKAAAPDSAAAARCSSATEVARAIDAASAPCIQTVVVTPAIVRPEVEASTSVTLLGRSGSGTSAALWAPSEPKFRFTSPAVPYPCENTTVIGP